MSPRIYLGLPDRQIVLCLTPKVGSSSIIATLLRHYGVEPRHVLHLNPALPFMDRAAVRRHVSHWRTAMFVRNPFDRLVACYVFHIVKTKLAHCRNLADLGFHRRMSFAEFIEKVCGNPQADPHTALQSRQFEQVDFVGKLEDIDVDWPRFREFSGIEDLGDLPRLNATNHDGRSFRSFYTDETRQMVEQAYAESLAVFDYEF